MRRRLVISFLALTLLALVALALPLTGAVRAGLERRATDTLQGSVEQFALLLDATTRSCSEVQLRVAQLGQPAITLSVVDATGGVLATTAADGRVIIGDELTDAAGGRVGREVSDGQLAVAVPLATGVCGRPLVVHATQPDHELQRERRTAGALIAAGVLLVAGATAGVAGWLGRRLAAPFEALAASARQLGAGDFSTRTPRSGLPEADAIGAALDDTAERLDHALARSTSFAADASHQLRTPLTALRLQLETLEALYPDDDAPRAALLEADRLQTTIEDLTALTRVDGTEIDTDLAALVSDRLRGVQSAAEEQHRSLVCDLGEVGLVRVRPAAVAQALQVLLDNALEHGRGQIRVSLALLVSSGDRAAADVGDDAPGEAFAGGGAGGGDGGRAGGGDGRVAGDTKVLVRLCVSDEGPAEPAVSPRIGGGRGLLLARALIAAEGGRLTIDHTPTATHACILLPRRQELLER